MSSTDVEKVETQAEKMEEEVQAPPPHGSTVDMNTVPPDPPINKWKKYLQTTMTALGPHLLVVLTMLAVVIGGGAGALLKRGGGMTPREIMYLNFPGELFLRMLRCLTLPLIFSSLVAAVGGLDISLSGRIGGRAIAYYLITAAIAVIIGIFLVLTIRPGEMNRQNENQTTGSTQKPSHPADGLMDIVRNMFPNNIVEAAMKSYQTEITDEKAVRKVTAYANVSGNGIFTGSGGCNGTGTFAVFGNFTGNGACIMNTFEGNGSFSGTGEFTGPDGCTGSGEFTGDATFSGNGNCSDEIIPSNINDWKIGGATVDGTNILGMVIFSVALGISLGILQGKGKPVLNVFICLSQAMLIIARAIIWLSPIGIMFLVAGQIIMEDSIVALLERVGKYFLTILIGHALHGFVVLPLIYSLFTRKLPFRFLLNMMPAVCTAFGTSSSAAALPVTIQCLEEKNGVDHRVTRFLVPIGSTINMDGTALYEAVATIWIAQMHGMALDAGDIITIGIISCAASVGAAGIPQGGLVAMAMVLYTVGLPAEYVSFVIPIDWLVDRFCTAINVLGDAVGAGLIYQMNKDHLDELDFLKEQERIETLSRTMMAENNSAGSGHKMSLGDPPGEPEEEDAQL